ncbi:unannotated protein [freshwater metagenome]|uniref:Unannotated protein n=1 Tax=freshwater metagenome TaxID=449393 RepID=A0A6J7J2U6_9ZZZZ|nr:ABC transporter substrate-binding protein [Actinomycetota bacterium]
MRIVSLVPHATELLFALGMGESVVGVSHACDFPPEARDLPQLTRSLLADDTGAAAVDLAVRERSERGEPLYALDGELLLDLEPDLIVTQALCEVCAVRPDDVVAIAGELAEPAQIVALAPSTLGETMGDIRTLAQATGARAEALDLIARQRERIDRVESALRDVERVGTVALEWLDPVFTAGHWTPQLIEMAGGLDLCGFAGEPSERSTWEAVAAAAPEVVLVMPCGYGAAHALEEAERHAGELRALGARAVVALDANATFSRPGPRLIDGLETLAHVLHPDLTPDAPSTVLHVEL